MIIKFNPGAINARNILKLRNKKKDIRIGDLINGFRTAKSIENQSDSLSITKKMQLQIQILKYASEFIHKYKTYEEANIAMDNGSWEHIGINAKSIVHDTETAIKMVHLVKEQILSQSKTVLLTQLNSKPQLYLRIQG